MKDDFGPRLPIEEPTDTRKPVADTAPEPTETSEPQPTTIALDMELDEDTTTTATTKHRFDPKAWWAGLSKKQRIALIAGIGVALIVLGGAAYMLFGRPEPTSPAPTITKHKAAPPAPTTEASRLTGLQVDPSFNTRPITGVMIENSTDARPQSGLDQAGVVFEAIAEGGITRFMALFQDNEPDYVGPVRSVRPYYLQWCQSFDCAIAHVGGSPEALQDIKSWNMKDLDQFFASGSYHRVNTRPAPHNMYTSLSDLRALEDKRGYTTSTFNSLERAKTDKLATTSKVAANSVDINFSSAPYNTHYDYDAATKIYKRSEGGAPHNVVDKSGTTTQLAPKVVISIVAPYSLEADHKHSVYGLTGSGKATIFQNGAVITGTWTKTDAKTQYSFLDDNGTTIELAPGQTWIAVVSSADKVSYR